MLLYLTEDITCIDLAANKLHLRSLENLFRADRYGHHFILSPHPVNLWLKNNLSYFSETLHGVILSLPSKYTQYGALLKSIETIVKIDTSTYPPKKNGINQWQTSLSIFDSLNTSNKVNIVCENLDDCGISILAAKAYQYENNLSNGINICCEQVPGGGSTTPDCLRHKIEDNKYICLCLTDSDKYSPLDKISETTKKCQHIVDKSNWISESIHTNAREIENILPLNLIKLSVDSYNFDRFDAIEQSTRLSQTLDHFDFKSGTCIRWINEKIQNSNDPDDFWKKAIENFISAGLIKSPPTKECSPNSCNTINTENCDLNIFPRLGKNLARTVLTQGKAMSAQKINEASKNCRNEHWYRLGKVIFEWSLSSKPSRA
jgi:hypothetical protein